MADREERIEREREREAALRDELQEAEERADETLQQAERRLDEAEERAEERGSPEAS
jgi:hypothetical protein